MACELYFNKFLFQKKKTYLLTNKNGNITFQNLWAAATIVVRGKFIFIQAYLKKQGKSQINNLILYLQKLKKE